MALGCKCSVPFMNGLCRVSLFFLHKYILYYSLCLLCDLPRICLTLLSSNRQEDDGVENREDEIGIKKVHRTMA